MTTIQLKTEIQKAVDKVPENALPDVLKYINSIPTNPEKKDVKKIIDRIIEEDAVLLKRLAE
jgi:hypothetical protein